MSGCQASLDGNGGAGKTRSPGIQGEGARRETEDRGSSQLGRACPCGDGMGARAGSGVGAAVAAFPPRLARLLAEGTLRQPEIGSTPVGRWWKKTRDWCDFMHGKLSGRTQNWA